MMNKLIRIWTIQPVEIWEKLKSKGDLFVDLALCGIQFEWLRSANDWLLNELKLRIKDYNGFYPWWGWFKPKPDLRRFRYFEVANSRVVRIELLMPEDRVQLVDYQAWHFVLNNFYLPLNNEELKRWEQKLILNNIDEYRNDLPEILQRCKVNSWSRVFDINKLSNSELWTAGCTQAVFERLDIRDVVTITEFLGQRKLRCQNKHI